MLESARVRARKVWTETTSRMVTLCKIVESGGEVRREKYLTVNEKAIQVRINKGT